MKILIKRAAGLLLVLTMVLTLLTPVSVTAKTSTKISFGKSAYTVSVGDKLTLKATITPKKSAKKQVVYQSSNLKIATISSKGVVTAKRKGTVKITAKIKGSNISCTTKVKVRQKKLTFDKSSYTVGTGGKITIKAKITPASAKDKLVWSTSNKKIATVSKKGVVTGRKTGSAKITATIRGTKISCTKTVKVKQGVSSIKTTPDKVTIKQGETAVIKTTVSPKKALQTVGYKSTNTKIATVDSKGNVKGVGVGTAKITVSAADGTNKKALVYVTVVSDNSAETVLPKNVSVTGVTLDQTNVSINGIGQTAVLKATITPVNATNKKVTFTSSDEKVAKVSADGLVTSMGTGNATITVKTEDGGFQAKTAVNVTNTAVAENNKEIEEALSKNPDTLTISTTAAETLIIPAGEYRNTTLVINAPNAEIENSGNFREIQLQAIAENTYIENAVGNEIIYTAKRGHIQVNAGASVGISVKGGDAVDITNYGNITNVAVSTKAQIKIDGTVTNNAIPMSISSEAAESKIETNQKLEIDAYARVELRLNPGAEETTAKVDTDSNIPAVFGLGRVTVEITDTNNTESVVAVYVPDANVRKVNVLGKINAVGEDGVTAAVGAAVYMIPYAMDITAENIESHFEREDIYKTITDESGNYSVEQVTIGNYYLIIELENYKTLFQQIVISSLASDEFSNGELYMVPVGDGEGIISGRLIDAVTGNNIDYPVRLRIRAGNNNLSGTPLKEMKSSDGTYRFSVETGIYTIQVLPEVDESAIEAVSTFVNVIVMPDRERTQDITVTSLILSDQVRFVLQWGNEASGAPKDLDSHLCGPRASGAGRFHTYFRDKDYGEYEEDAWIRYADLDQDDVDWDGPETTTIYKRTNGTYSFYVYDYTNQHNEENTGLSASKAQVEIFEGKVSRGTFYVPLNKVGTLWHVCDYDALTGVITPVNTVTFWEGDSGNVGLSEVDLARAELGSALESVQNYLDKLADNEAKQRLQTLIEEAQTIFENAGNVAEIKEICSKIREELNKIQSLEISGINSEDVLEWESGTDSVWIYGKTETIPEFTVTVPEGVSSEVADSQGTDYVKTIILTDESGYERIYKVYYELDNSVFRISSIMVGDGIEATDFYTDGDTIIVRGEVLPETFAEYFSVTFAETNVRADIQNNEDSEYYTKLLKATYGSVTRTFYVHFETDYDALAIAGVEDGDNILTHYWTTEEDVDGNTISVLTLKGLNESLANLTVNFNDSQATWRWQESDIAGYAGKITASKGVLTKIYYVRYICDTNPLLILDVTDDENTYLSKTINHLRRRIDITGTNEELGNTYQLTLSEGCYFYLSDWDENWHEICVYNDDDDEVYYDIYYTQQE